MKPGCADPAAFQRTNPVEPVIDAAENRVEERIGCSCQLTLGPPEGGEIQTRSRLFQKADWYPPRIMLDRNVSWPILSLHSDGKRLSALASAGVGVSGQV
jgi:hypothetical protein